MSIEQRIFELGIILPEAPKAGGVYSPYRAFGEKFVYISGCGPAINGVIRILASWVVICV